jgi:SdrD B-like protein
MRHEVSSSGLRDKAQQLMDGPLKHIKAAALAAALLPLASVAATPASAQSACGFSAGVCGKVFNDLDGDGIQDAGEPGIEGAKVFVCSGLCEPSETMTMDTAPDGTYFFDLQPDGTTYTVAVQTPPNTQASPTDATDDTFDSDGTPSGVYSVVTNVIANGAATDFGFFTTRTNAPGTGTPGYWKNHPEAWPASGITVGGVYYAKGTAIAWLGKVGKDKSATMFSSLVSAMLNSLIGNEHGCVDETIVAANSWMTAHPVGSNVAGSSAAWAEGESLHITLDNYNNGRLCAPHRN